MGKEEEEKNYFSKQALPYFRKESKGSSLKSPSNSSLKSTSKGFGVKLKTVQPDYPSADRVIYSKVDNPTFNNS